MEESAHPKSAPVIDAPANPAAPGPRVFIETYGCQMNIADSELVGGVLRRAGNALAAAPEEADVILLNTCAIREHAEERVLRRLTDLAKFKHARPETRL